MLKNVMLEGEMEQYLIDNGYDVSTGEENLLDSCKVVDHAINLDYEPYMMDGAGDFNQTLVFIRKRFDELEYTTSRATEFYTE